VNLPQSQLTDKRRWNRRSLLGSSVTAGTKADGNGNGIIDAGDYLAWRKLMSTAGGSSLNGAEIPQPSALLLAVIALVLVSTRRACGLAPPLVTV
jgi:hypothetical protein